ncbi:MAG: tetratricopeptide repeat protein [Pyrinomonadaceae bacterium]
MKNSALSRYIAAIAFVLFTFFPISAQTDQELGEAASKAITFFQQQRFSEAIPHFEVLVKAIPDQPQARFMYGFSLLAKSKQISDTAEAKKLSEKALEQFLKAKELGLKDGDNESMIALLTGKPAPEAEPMYSLNKDAEKLMNEGESFFAQSKYDEAIKNFEKALALDPKIYQAAISGGDCFVAKSDWENAEKWYQRGIAIDPTRETAYRYSATPLMKQKKYDLARDRYVEAFITEPYSQMSPRGIGQWADVTNAKLGHPVADIPEVTFDPSGKAVPKTAISAEDNSAKPWLAYLTTREAWKKDKFAKTFPKETTYRHSLAEEAESIRTAISAAKEQKSPNKQFDLLAKLDTEGLLEAYILLANPTRGIAQDHAEYLKNSRAKLRKYVVDHVIQK